MASTYTWGQIFNETRLLGAKNVQVGATGTNDVLIAQAVSSSMWNFYPWKYTLQNTAPLSMPAVDGQQDYPRVATCYRMTRAAIWRTDVTPYQIFDYDIRKELPADLYPRAYNAIKAISDEIDAGVWRLESAINVPAGTLLDIRVQYQPYHTTIASMSQTIWFDDSYFETAQAGLLYKLYKFGEDARAGTVTYDTFGRASYTGQLGEFMGLMRQKASEEDANSVQGLFPEESLAGWANGAPGPLLLGI